MKSVNPPVAGTLASASLTTRFALYSFLCIGAMTVALWFLVSNYLINQILEHEWQSTAQIVRADVRKGRACSPSNFAMRTASAREKSMR